MSTIRSCASIYVVPIIIINGENPSHTFTVKSLTGDLVGVSDPTSTGLYSVFWKDVYPKKD